MDVFEVASTILAVKGFRPDPIPEEVVGRILEAGRLTSSAMNRQEWDFVVVRDRERLRRLAELARTGSYIDQAGLCIALVVPEKTIAFIDGARAAQTMTMVAWGEGVGSTFVGNVMDSQPIRDLLKVPEGKVVQNLIPFGYPTRKLGKGVKRRKALSEVAHQEVYGQPFPAP